MRTEDIPELNDNEGKLKLFAGKIEANDIQQRGLGDCYFLSVLAAMTEFPKRIRKMFVDQELNPHDIFGINMFKNGHAH